MDQDFAALLNRLGLPTLGIWSLGRGTAELSDELSRVLPDPVGPDQVEAQGIRPGLFRGELIGRRGGRP